MSTQNGEELEVHYRDTLYVKNQLPKKVNCIPKTLRMSNTIYNLVRKNNDLS